MAHLNGRSATITLSHQEYTVGWICALPCELTAAEAMFDVIHKPLPNPPQDKNVYSFGSIAGHNVVITTLPLGVYGTTSATTVAIRMTSTFRAIRNSFLVGVGGGVPIEDIRRRDDGHMPVRDIRLGDVVIGVPSSDGPAVVQYDYGKTLASGLQNTGNLNKPSPQVLAAVSRIRANHAAFPSKVPAIIEQALMNDLLVENGYSYPGADKDIAYQSNCSHDTDYQECIACTPEPTHREQRRNSSPHFHYGSVASGNQVIKNRAIRDRLHQTLKTICFEMEAAGVMDYFPALVIRGICDYCDSRKDKTFQPYAALAAAAFTKELLSFIPQQQLADDRSATLFKTVVEPRSEAIVQDLNFNEARSRFLTIKDPHSKTLRWFPDHPVYLSWLKDADFHKHRGFIWIKGKPGAGKSTLMKFILSQAEHRSFTISYFFNARGTELQKTTLGMYRSLLFQLLQHFSELQHSLEILNFRGQMDNIDVLKNLFKAAIKRLDQPLICLIDALDESSEDEIRELFEDLQTIIECIEPGYFRVCCSSRHYPHISIDIGLDFDLDKEEGHADDINNYVNAKLRIGNSKEAKTIKSDLVQKAAGVFLWVVLVVQTLQRAYDHGQVYAMRKKLDEVPTKLDDLFRDILLRDRQNLNNLVSSIQWILYSIRPLTVVEFYHAMLLIDDEYDVNPFNPEEITDEDMERFITSSSKGLLEKTQGSKPTIQVIHESVREYLLGVTLTELWHGFEPINERTSNAQMSLWCSKYILGAHPPNESEYPSNDYAESPPPSTSRFPFIEYAETYVLEHAELAEKYGIPQDKILETFSKRPWVLRFSHNLSNYNLRVALVEHNLVMLYKRYVAFGFDQRYGTPDKHWEITFAIQRQYTELSKILFHPAPGPLISNKQFNEAVNQLCDCVNRRLPIESERRFSMRSTKAFKGFYTDSWMSLLSLDKDNKLTTYLLYSEEWLNQQSSETIKRLWVVFLTRQMRSSYNYQGNHREAEFDDSKQHMDDLLFCAIMTENMFALDKLLELKVDPNGRHFIDRLCTVYRGGSPVEVHSLRHSGSIALRPLCIALLWHNIEAVRTLMKTGALMSVSLPESIAYQYQFKLASLFSDIAIDEPFTPVMIGKVFKSDVWEDRHRTNFSLVQQHSNSHLTWLIIWLLNASRKRTGNSCEDLFVGAGWPLERIAETLGVALNDLRTTGTYLLGDLRFAAVPERPPNCPRTGK